MEQLAKAISNGSLCGARGNSGVILSQLFRGFTKAIKEVEEIDVITLADALVKCLVDQKILFFIFHGLPRSRT